jgi:hypothetical protein
VASRQFATAGQADAVVGRITGVARRVASNFQPPNFPVAPAWMSEFRKLDALQLEEWQKSIKN